MTSEAREKLDLMAKINKKPIDKTIFNGVLYRGGISPWSIRHNGGMESGDFTMPRIMAQAKREAHGAGCEL